MTKSKSTQPKRSFRADVARDSRRPGNRCITCSMIHDLVQSGDTELAAEVAEAAADPTYTPISVARTMVAWGLVDSLSRHAIADHRSRHTDRVAHILDGGVY